MSFSPPIFIKFLPIDFLFDLLKYQRLLLSIMLFDTHLHLLVMLPSYFSIKFLI